MNKILPKKSGTTEPYVSIDLETTGLPEDNCHILQLAAIFNDGTGKSLISMPYIKLTIDNQCPLNWESDMYNKNSKQ